MSEHDEPVIYATPAGMGGVSAEEYQVAHGGKWQSASQIYDGARKARRCGWVIVRISPGDDALIERQPNGRLKVMLNGNACRTLSSGVLNIKVHADQGVEVDIWQGEGVGVGEGRATRIQADGPATLTFQTVGG